ncbi:MAG: iron ABC transporter permease [Gammaproteobacteria bacterium]|jgi:iron complex transport system permease protein
MTPFRSSAAGLSLPWLFIVGAMLAVAAASVLLALCLGSMDIGAAQVLHALFGDGGGLAGRVVREVRLPRVLSGFVVGGTLALAGALMQVLLRNPLAEPYVLGVSGGAAVFVLMGMLAGVAGVWLNLAAFAGAFASMLVVFLLARLGGAWDPLRILLTGVVVAAGWGAAISLILAVSPAGKLHGMLFWLMGDLSYAHFSSWYGLVLLAVLLACLPAARGMNLLARGELQAAALGVSVLPLQYFIYFTASLLTAVAVMQAGSIGFVGLVIPHTVRLLFGGDHRLLVPVSVLLGGSLLVLADGLARTVIAPQQLPVGVLTALIGVPVFLLLLQTTAREQKA